MQKNRIELAGYLAAKPELRYLPSGTKVANARIGESYRYRDQEGQAQSHTNWHSLSFYDDLADVALTYEQGENLFVEGTLQQRKFTPKDGSTRTAWEVVVRSCHLVESPRIERPMAVGAPSAADKVPPETVEPQEREARDATWPV
jgi:single-strand DNA-binding protein